jgi:hypothetical protein
MPNPLYQAYLRVARAHEHFRDFVDLIERFTEGFAKDLLGKLQLDKNTLRPEVDQLERAWHEIAWIPEMASIYSGEAIQNLRIALDYMVFLLAKHDAGGVEQEGTQFLIEDGKGSIAAHRGFDFHAPLRLKGMTQPHIAMIENLQPYKGIYWTRRLRDLSNPDKHRHLFNPTGAAPMNIRVSSGPSTSYAGQWPCRIYEAFGPNGEDVYVYLSTSMNILFKDAGGMYLPVIPILEELLIKVPETLEAFEPEFQ